MLRNRKSPGNPNQPNPKKAGIKMPIIQCGKRRKPVFSVKKRPCNISANACRVNCEMKKFQQRKKEHIIGATTSKRPP
jgi:hypothetical protein